MSADPDESLDTGSPPVATSAMIGNRFPRKRRSYPKDDDDGSCKSTLAATADEALFEPSFKVLKPMKPDSPGEARDATKDEPESAQVVPASKDYFQKVSDEILYMIFSFLFEKDLATTSGVCRRFNRIANDHGLWKKLFEDTFEYGAPLTHPMPGKFEFRPAHRWRGFVNPWKESLIQLVSHFATSRLFHQAIFSVTEFMFDLEWLIYTNFVELITLKQ